MIDARRSGSVKNGSVFLYVFFLRRFNKHCICVPIAPLAVKNSKQSIFTPIPACNDLASRGIVYTMPPYGCALKPHYTNLVLLTACYSFGVTLSALCGRGYVS